ncbi:MAG: glycosyltransferase family 39 protein [Candidatus Erginobacter occultus]|nr:glycosyltransferase family 39 protein [Candidatus Erginobacter occultus]
MSLNLGYESSRLWIGIFLAAFLLRLGYALVQPEEFWDEDEGVYVTMADNFLAGEGLIYTPYRKATFPPLYPFLLAGLLGAGLPLFPAARVFQALLGAFSCLLIGGVARRAFIGLGDRVSRGAGFLAAALLAVYPIAVIYPARLMTENLLIFLLPAAVLSLLKSISSPRPRFWILLGGVLIGLGVLSRPTLLPFLLMVLVWLAVAGYEKPAYPVRAGVFLLAFVLVILPWQIRNYRVLGAVVPITSAAGANLYIANNPAAVGGSMGYRYLMDAGVFHLGAGEDELAYNRHYRDRAFEFIRENPGRFLSLSLQRLIWFYHLDYHYRSPIVLVLGFQLMLLLALAGFWLARCSWKGALLPGMAILNFTLVHMVFLSEGRYRLPLIPFLLAFAALSLSSLFFRARDSASEK